MKVLVWTDLYAARLYGIAYIVHQNRALLICKFESDLKLYGKSNYVFYYQYFQTLKEEPFISTGIKPIIENSNETNETLSDLNPDTVYLIGILLITDDGNFNDQDIVYGEFKTSCIRKYFQQTIKLKLRKC